MSTPKSESSLSRRKFLGRAGVAIAGGAVGLHRLLNSTAQAQDPGIFRDKRPLELPPGYCTPPQDNGLTGVARANRAFDIRVDAAQRERAVPIPPHLNNGDEARYPNRIGNFSKGFKH